ncbi:MAG: AEC family transporter [Actinomycetota bacterium]|nr:AEC family transporter [Actinomycetota bacterium]
MLLVVLTVLVAGAAGVAAERRLRIAETAARRALLLMLYVLVPFVSFVNIAHLHITVAGGTGLALAGAATGLAGVGAWLAGRALRLPRPQAGALICCAILVNTGYLGYPMTVTLLGSRQLGSAIVYDQLVSGPMLFVVGFGVGAAFGTRAGEGLRARGRAFLSRNPPLLAVLAGLLAPASLAPATLVSASHVVVGALLPLGFFVVGVNVSAERREDSAPLLEKPDRAVLAAVALRLLVAPLLLVTVSAAVVRLPSAYLLQAAMPTAINSLLVGHAYGLHQRMIATAIVWSTVVTLLLGLVIAAV